MLRLLWQPLGYESYADFVNADPDGARFFRVALYVTNTSLHRRHVANRKDSLVQAAMLSDSRVASAARVESAARIHGKIL